MRFFLTISLFILVLQLEGQQYQGYGSAVTGGTGMQTVHVVNVNPTGAGSLYNAIGSNRTIVFDVSGTILNFSWDSSNEFAVSNLTIDGQGKITLDNNNHGNCLSFQQGCNNIIVKNIRLRNAGNDGLNLVGAKNVVIDHVSSSGNRDGDLDLTEGASNVTVTNCILGTGNPVWSGAMLVAYANTNNISVYRNLFYPTTSGGVAERDPFVHSNGTPVRNDLMIDFRNNVVYKWDHYGSGVDYGGSLQCIGNYYYSTSNPGKAIDTDADPQAGSNGQAYASGNVSGNAGIHPDNATNHAQWSIPANAQVSTMDACTAAFFVKANAGCRPLDATDQAFINSLNLFTCTATPVTLIYFKYDSRLKQLQWSTATEINNDRFEIEQSTDGITWKKIAEVKSLSINGNSDVVLNYSYGIR